MLSAKMQQALNQQIKKEADAANLYLAMASWCDTHALRGSATFIYSHAEQERMHMMKLFRYVNDAGGQAVAPEIRQPTSDYKSLSDVFEAFLAHEREVTSSINTLVDLCLAEKDHSSFNFLQWYVAEQHEEERLLTQIVDLLKITGHEGRGLFMADKEIGSMTGK